MIPHGSDKFATAVEVNMLRSPHEAGQDPDVMVTSSVMWKSNSRCLVSVPSMQ